MRFLRLPNLLLTKVFLCIICSLFAQNVIFSQATQKKSKQKLLKKQVSSANQRTNQITGCIDEPKEDTHFYAPIRYVIVYNWVHDTKTRRIEILMEPEQFNEQNLICIFSKINKRFPSPADLFITVHTSLAMVETPEEFDVGGDSNDTRFRHTFEKYKVADYSKYSSGREVFNYTTELFPNYKEKIVVISEGKK